MWLRAGLMALVASSVVAVSWPAFAQSNRGLTIRPYQARPRPGENVRTPSTPNVPIEAEAGESPDGPLAHGNCSTAGGGSGNAAMGGALC